MATRKFLTSVADVYGYDTTTEELLFTSKTLLDSSIEVSLGSAPVRGGRGNQLQYVYYHTGEMKFNLTDTQWNLALLGATVGADETAGMGVYAEEQVTMSGSSGIISGSALAVEGTTVYGWGVAPSGGAAKLLTFADTHNFTVSGSEAGDWCVRYYKANPSSGKGITVYANMIPKIVRLVMETQLNSSDVSTNKIGTVQIMCPRVTLSGAFSIAMKADGVSNTPLTGMALAYTPPTGGADACQTNPYYAQIVEFLDAGNWYDEVVALAVDGGDFTIANGGTATLSVWAVPSSGGAFKAQNANLTFAVIPDSGAAAATLTVGANTGVISAGAVAGSAIVTAAITAKPTVDTTVIPTVLA